MIESMHIENFKCFKNFDIELGKFNVLIGPNDSGKTAFLQAITLVHAAVTMGGMPLGVTVAESGLRLETTTAWQGRTSQGMLVRANVKREHVDEGACVVDILLTPRSTSIAALASGKQVSQAAEWNDLRSAVSTKLLDFDSGTLRRRSSISTDARWAMGVEGGGLPTFLEDLLRADRQKFFEFENAFYKRFPHYRSLVIAKEGSDNVIRFKTRSGQELSATEVSDGVMLYLGFLAMSYHPSPPAILLIEEPENGVHHAGLENIIGALKGLSEDKQVQIIATTHSPYLLDLVQPEEVRVFTKDDEGAVHATNMASVPDVQAMKKHFQTGEIWTCLSEDRLVRGAGEKR